MVLFFWHRRSTITEVVSPCLSQSIICLSTSTGTAGFGCSEVIVPSGSTVLQRHADSIGGNE